MKKRLAFLFLIAPLFFSNGLIKVEAGNNNITAPKQDYLNDTIDIDAYYQKESLDGLKSQPLLEKLAESMNTNHRYYTNYGDIKGANALSDEDIDEPSKIVDFYTGISFDNKWDGGVTWNREHVWCKNRSNGLYPDVSSDSKRGAGADIHQLKPSFQSVNSARKDKYYSDLNKQGEELLYEGQKTGNYTNNISFEPRDEIKGDVARILMYMYTHYSSEITTNAARLNTTDTITTSKSGALRINDIFHVESGLASDAWKTILKWNDQDDVDFFEMNRNNYCASITGVRNPYIDHPEFATMIWDESYSGQGALKDSAYDKGEDVAIEDISLYHDQATIKVDEQRHLHVNYTPYYASEKYKVEIWESSNPEVATIDQDGVVTGVSDGVTTIKVKVGSLEKTCLIMVEANIQETQAIYTVDTKTSVISSGNIPSGASATYSQTHQNKGQMTSGNSTTLTLKGYQGYCIRGIVLNIRSNASAGAGGVVVKAGESQILAKINEGTPFNNSSWAGKYTNTLVDVELKMLDSKYVIKENEDITIHITASVNSLFINEYRIDYDIPREEIPVEKIVLSHETINLKVGESARLNATIMPENATDKRLKYICSNTKVATVSSNGLITALKKGSAIIQVQSYDEKVVASCMIFVEDEVVPPTSSDPVDPSSSTTSIVDSSSSSTPSTSKGCFKSSFNFMTLISILAIFTVIYHKRKN